MQEHSSLYALCPKCFTENDWPIFTHDGFSFWATRFTEAAWYEGWHMDTGNVLGARIRRHPSHEVWMKESYMWSQPSVQRTEIPPVSEFMLWLHRQPCNYERYRLNVMQERMRMTQWGDAALALIISNMIPKLKAVGYKKVKHHWRIASKNSSLSFIMSCLNIEFDHHGVHRTSNIAEVYIFHMLESAHNGDIVAAENLFCIGMYVLFVAYDPWVQLH